MVIIHIIIIRIHIYAHGSLFACNGRRIGIRIQYIRRPTKYRLACVRTTYDVYVSYKEPRENTTENIGGNRRVILYVHIRNNTTIRFTIETDTDY